MMKTLKTGMLIVCLLFELILQSCCCITTTGQSSQQMRDSLLKSYLFRSVMLYYPNGVPANTENVYPDLGPEQIKEISANLSDHLKYVQKVHKNKYDVLTSAFVGANIKRDAKAEVRVVQFDLPIAETDERGVIEIDVRVLQALFRGALLDYMDYKSTRDPFFKTSKKDSSFDFSGKSEQEAIRELRQLIQEIQDMQTQTITEDIFSDRRPWFKLARISIDSNRMNLQNRYTGVVLFLLAHEYGHLVLQHHELRDELLHAASALDDQKEIQDEFCYFRQAQEYQADAYALVLLSGQVHPLFDVPDAFGASGLGAGYGPFFDYTYKLSEFGVHAGSDKNGSDCPYPTVDERRRAAADLYDQIREIQRNQMWDVLFQKQK